eukprot:IDg20611t1
MRVRHLSARDTCPRATPVRALHARPSNSRASDKRSVRRRGGRAVGGRVAVEGARRQPRCANGDGRAHAVAAHAAQWGGRDGRAVRARVGDGKCARTGE